MRQSVIQTSIPDHSSSSNAMGPSHVMATTNSSVLRLILGLGRSGTSWLSSVLAKSATPLRFLSEPLCHVRPKLQLFPGTEHASIAYQSSLSDDHALLRAYRKFVGMDDDWKNLGIQHFVHRDDIDWQVGIVKEVHALLATEALVKLFRCPTLIIVRDPIYSVDSLLARDGLYSSYLVPEQTFVMASDFLERFIPMHRTAIDKANQGLIQTQNATAEMARKVLTQALIKRMFEQLAFELTYVKLISYESLCANPFGLFAESAQFLGLDFDAASIDFLHRTMTSTGDHSDPHSVFRDTASQIDRKLKFITPTAKYYCDRILDRCGLL